MYTSMIKKPKKYHFIYKTTNLNNNEFYMGMHSTDNLDDGYLGSGNRLKRSIKKYGKGIFRREIIDFFNSREQLEVAEKRIVSEELLKDPLCLNLTIGGQGGDVHPWSSESRKKSSDKLKNRDNTWGDKVSKALKGKKPPKERILKAAESRRGERNGSWKNVDSDRVIQLRSEGKTMHDIAIIMGISRSTVSRKLYAHQTLGHGLSEDHCHKKV